MWNVDIEQVKFLEDYQLDIMLSNGHRIIYNMKSKIKTARFAGISDTEVFRSGEIINERLIRWNALTELSLGEIMITMN